MSESKTPTSEPMTRERLGELMGDYECGAGPDGGDILNAADELIAQERAKAERLADARDAYKDEVDRLRVDMGAVIAENNRLAGAAKQLEAEVNVLRTEQGAVLRGLGDALGTSPVTLGQAAVHAVKALEDARIACTTAEMQRDDYRTAHKAAVAERDAARTQVTGMVRILSGLLKHADISEDVRVEIENALDRTEGAR